MANMAFYLIVLGCCATADIFLAAFTMLGVPVFVSIVPFVALTAIGLRAGLRWTESVVRLDR